MRTLPVFRAKLTILVSLFVVTVMPTSVRAAWINETDLPEEADYVNLQFPSSFTVSAGTLTPSIYGRIFENGMTQDFGPNALILADVGYGPVGSDPRTSGGWSWYSAVFNTQAGNDDEYQASFVAPLFNGTYSYTYRFSIDAGSNLTAADLDGAGSNAGQTFDPSNLGLMTVIDGIIPEPGTGLLVIAGLLGLAGWRRARD